VALTVTYKMLNSAVTASYLAGFADALVKLQERPEQTAELSETIAAGSVKSEGLSRFVLNHPLVPVLGTFRDDPTWERFMQTIEEYSDFIDAKERER
jgi:hypothetical protein